MKEIKRYYFLRTSFVGVPVEGSRDFAGSLRYTYIVEHAIYQYSSENNLMLYCSERALIEFFMYLIWLVNEDSVSMEIEVLEYENKDNDEANNWFILACFPTSTGTLTVERRYAKDGGYTHEVLDVEHYDEDGYIVNSWE